MPSGLKSSTQTTVNRLVKQKMWVISGTKQGFLNIKELQSKNCLYCHLMQPYLEERALSQHWHWIPAWQWQSVIHSDHK